MKNKIYIIVSAIVAVIALIAACFTISPASGEIVYFCDHHPMSQHIDIDVSNNKNDVVYKITDIFFDYTDSIVLDDGRGNAIRELYNYDFVSKNDHVVLNGNGTMYGCESEGVGDANAPRKVFDNKRAQVGTIEYNRARTKMQLKDVDGTVVAECASSVFRTDCAVTIFDGCQFDNTAVIMMFLSYMNQIVNLA